MILGIDVGGTHTDAVLVENFRLIAKTKVLTSPTNMMSSLMEASSRLLSGRNIDQIERIVLSTTISTNAIVQKKINRVAMVLLSGPGLAPSLLNPGQDAFFARGYVNHRGIPVENISRREIIHIGEEIAEKGIRQVAVVGKFSSRNPQQERDVAELLSNDTLRISMGHTLSGQLNFPRRISTTYLNAAISDIYRDFAKDVQTFISELKTDAPVYILKADGGTILLTQSLNCPVETIHSGPAAGIMGVLATADIREDAVALDIGGTTTDISVFAEGVPLLEPSGVTIDGRKTLIRGLLSKSIGIGGDSVVRLKDGKNLIGPEREGPAAALDGPCPTPTDAMILLNVVDYGDRNKALKALSALASKRKISPEELAREIIDETTSAIAGEVRQILAGINNKPVYTIHELLEGRIIEPKMLYVVGGPAALAPFIGEKLDLPYSIPDHSEVSNALGVALARTTAEMTILADTEKRELIVSEAGQVKKIPSDFTLHDVVEVGKATLRDKAAQMGADPLDMMIEITEAQEFNMIRDFYTTGKNIRVKVQIKPGLISAGQMR